MATAHKSVSGPFCEFLARSGGVATTVVFQSRVQVSWYGKYRDLLFGVRMTFDPTRNVQRGVQMHFCVWYIALFAEVAWYETTFFLP